MRDRLIAILRLMPATSSTIDGQGKIRSFTSFSDLADYLIAHGVIVPPCKVGDLLFMPWEYGGVSGVAVLGVTYMVIDKDEIRIMTDFSTDDEEYFDLYFGGKFVLSDFGKTVFLTREEAEKALAERSGE